MGNKFTAIYTESWMSGSHRHTVVKMARTEQVDGESIVNMLAREHIEIDALVYLFHGHPRMEGKA